MSSRVDTHLGHQLRCGFPLVLQYRQLHRLPLLPHDGFWYPAHHHSTLCDDIVLEGGGERVMREGTLEGVTGGWVSWSLEGVMRG